MEIFKRHINNNEYEFVNVSWETSNAWGHETTLFRNGVELYTNRVRYYNRTWECYTYQTCMRGAVNCLEHKRLEELKESFKEIKDIKKLTKRYELEYNKYLSSDETFQELKQLYDSLNYRYE